MRTVEFLVSHGSYAKGEVAGFEDKIANRLVQRRIARFCGGSGTVKDDSTAPNAVPVKRGRGRPRKNLQADASLGYVTK